jgi:hypothetical protein
MAADRSRAVTRAPAAATGARRLRVDLHTRDVRRAQRSRIQQRRHRCQSEVHRRGREAAIDEPAPPVRYRRATVMFTVRSEEALELVPSVESSRNSRTQRRYAARVRTARAWRPSQASYSVSTWSPTSMLGSCRNRRMASSAVAPSHCQPSSSRELRQRAPCRDKAELARTAAVGPALVAPSSRVGARASAADHSSGISCTEMT